MVNYILVFSSNAFSNIVFESCERKEREGREGGRVGGRGDKPTSEENEEVGDFSRCICPYCQ